MMVRRRTNAQSIVHQLVTTPNDGLGISTNLFEIISSFHHSKNVGIMREHSVCHHNDNHTIASNMKNSTIFYLIFLLLLLPPPLSDAFDFIYSLGWITFSFQM